MDPQQIRLCPWNQHGHKCAVKAQKCNIMLTYQQPVCSHMKTSVKVYPWATHSSLRPQRRLVGLPNLVRLSLSSRYSMSAMALGTPSQAKMRMMMTAFSQWWPARWRTRHSSFSFSLPRRITWQEIELLIILAFTHWGDIRFNILVLYKEHNSCSSSVSLILIENYILINKMLVEP